MIPNTDQLDEDYDNVGDECDDCLGDPNNDLDNDGHCEADDNCPGIHNPSQADSDNDGRGNACEDCCEGLRGNVNFDGNDETDIADVVFLINYFFGFPQGPQPPCFEEADVNSDNSFDISDMVYLINYILETPSGPKPNSCLGKRYQ